jgi:hypothetical protein
MRWLGCAFTIIGIILVIFIITHLTEIWNMLESLLRGFRF